MTTAVEAAAYLKKALRSLESARLLLSGGDTDGACNRAYYAMFNAAQAALSPPIADGVVTVYKTHNGLIAAFGKLVINNGGLDAELGDR